TLSLGCSGADSAICGDLNVTGNVTIAGGGAAATTVNTNLGGALFQVAPGASATLTGMKLQGNSAVQNDGTLTLDGCVIIGVYGLTNTGTATVTNSTFSG